MHQCGVCATVSSSAPGATSIFFICGAVRWRGDRLSTFVWDVPGTGSVVDMCMGRAVPLQVVRNTISPEWSEYYVFPVGSTMTTADVLLFNWQRYGPHTLLGQVSIPVDPKP